ncbi:hypothetical protein SCHPADRAFT_832267, partial [Schizopora paradoxa]
MNDQLDKLLVAGVSDAADEYYRKRIEVCHDETCGTILTDFKIWATNVDAKDEHIFWLSGLAGTGKSTFSKTVAEWAIGEGILGGKYFFSRDEGLMGKAAHFIPTIAYEVAKFDPLVKENVSRVLGEHDRFTFAGNYAKRFQKLVVEPLKKLRPNPSTTLEPSAPPSPPLPPRKLMLLVIDSLDECDDQDAVKETIPLLMELVESNPHIRVLLTSRPEKDIEDIFSGKSKRLFYRRRMENCVFN